MLCVSVDRPRRLAVMPSKATAALIIPRPRRVIYGIRNPGVAMKETSHVRSVSTKERGSNQSVLRLTRFLDLHVLTIV
jgi:hypothetical protein